MRNQLLSPILHELLRTVIMMDITWQAETIKNGHRTVRKVPVKQNA